MSVEESPPSLTKHQVYYARHREEKCKKVSERYHNRPDVIARRAERERIIAEKRAEREAKQRAEQEAKERKKAEKERQLAEYQKRQLERGERMRKEK